MFSTVISVVTPSGSRQPRCLVSVGELWLALARMCEDLSESVSVVPRASRQFRRDRYGYQLAKNWQDASPAKFCELN